LPISFNTSLAALKACRSFSFFAALQFYFNPVSGHHMPGRCPQCGTAGKLMPIDADQDQMSEGEEAEYEAGMWGFAFCRACQSNVFWQV
jgi:hypothetical protein